MFMQVTLFNPLNNIVVQCWWRKKIILTVKIVMMVITVLNQYTWHATKWLQLLFVNHWCLSSHTSTYHLIHTESIVKNTNNDNTIAMINYCYFNVIIVNLLVVTWSWAWKWWIKCLSLVGKVMDSAPSLDDHSVRPYWRAILK